MAASVGFVLCVSSLPGREPAVERPARLSPRTELRPPIEGPPPIMRPALPLAARADEQASPERPESASIDRLFAAVEEGSVTVDDVLDVSVELLSQAERSGPSVLQGTGSLAASLTGDGSKQCVLTFERTNARLEPARLSLLLRLADDGRPEHFSLLVPTGSHPGVLGIHRDSSSWNAASQPSPDDSDDDERWEDPVPLAGSLDDPRAALVADALQRVPLFLDGARPPECAGPSATGNPTWRNP